VTTTTPRERAVAAVAALRDHPAKWTLVVAFEAHANAEVERALKDLLQWAREFHPFPKNPEVWAWSPIVMERMMAVMALVRDELNRRLAALRASNERSGGAVSLKPRHVRSWFLRRETA
jgi:hypothetical protein